MRFVSLAILATALAACGLGGGANPSATAGNDALSQGLAAHNSGKLDDAIGLYHQALAKDPTNKFALFNLGQIEDTRGHLVAAEAWYRLALESDKSMSAALLNLGIVRQKVGDSVESASLLRSAIRVDPNSASAHYNLGLALRSLGLTAEAVTEFATAQRLDSTIVPPTATPARPSPTR